MFERLANDRNFLWNALNRKNNSSEPVKRFSKDDWTQYI